MNAQQYSILDVRIVPDHANGGIVTWVEGVSPNTATTVHTATFDNLGNVGWGGGTSDGILVSNPDNSFDEIDAPASDDGVGGVFVCFNIHDCPFAQHVQANQTVEWVNTQISMSANPDNTAPILAHASGSTQVFWRHQDDPVTGSGSIRMQLVNDDGIRQLDYAGVVIDGSNNAITSATQYPWNAYPPLGERIAPIAPDVATGVVATATLIVVWEGWSNGPGTPSDIFVELVNNRGQKIWTAAQTPFGTPTYGRYEPRVTVSVDRTQPSRPVEHYVVTWLEQIAPGVDIFGNPQVQTMAVYSQSFSTVGGSGQRDWSANTLLSGMPCSSLPFAEELDDPRICPDDIGGAWVAWWNAHPLNNLANNPSVQVRRAASYIYLPPLVAAPQADVDLINACVIPFMPGTPPLWAASPGNHTICRDGMKQGRLAGATIPGGCIVTFAAYDVSGNSTSGEDIYATYVYAEQPWTFIGPPPCPIVTSPRYDPYTTALLCGAPGDQDEPFVIYGGTNPNAFNCYVSWTDHAGGDGNIWAQEFGMNLLPVAGIWFGWGQQLTTPPAIGTISQSSQLLLTDDLNAVWMDRRRYAFNPIPTTDDLVATRHNPVTGNPDVALFPYTSALLCNDNDANGLLGGTTFKGLGGPPCMVGLGDNSIVAAWVENRLTGGLVWSSSILAQRLLAPTLTFDKSARSRHDAHKAEIEPKVTILNYPNPATTSTSICYSLAESRDVTIDVFDMLGHRIERLVDGTQTAGRHSVTLQTESFQPGLYLCRLSSYGMVSSVQILVTK